MNFHLYKIRTLEDDIIFSIITTHSVNSHLLYFSNKGVRQASTASPQRGVDYDNEDRVKIIGVDMI